MQPQFTLVIYGSRNFTDYSYFINVYNHVLMYKHGIKIITGNDPGVSLLARRYAYQLGIECQVYSSDWVNKGVRAAHVKNSQMLNSIRGNSNSGMVLIWDGKTKLYKDTLKLANLLSIDTRSFIVNSRTRFAKNQGIKKVGKDD